MSITVNDFVEGRGPARFDFPMSGFAILALLVIEMEVVPIVFDPCGTTVVWDLKGAKLDPNQLGGRSARWFWPNQWVAAWVCLLVMKDRWLMWHEEFSIQMKEKEDEKIMIRPPPEPPQWENCAPRVRKNVLLVLFCYFQSRLFYNFYFNIFMTNNKEARLMFLFVLVDSFLYGGNQADSAANSLKGLTFSAISLALFGVDYSMSDLGVREPLGFWSFWVKGSYFLFTIFLIVL
ncbi:unnamed protein product [Cuscuta europaea]|uniref:Uncharacterized protein n=1 Tax=Cuscuta europaea TaxID=41803 RepID=A0A9P0YXK4_CUSEU|nr:unnamed protein product [Cuscuta europaea]